MRRARAILLTAGGASRVLTATTSFMFSSLPFAHAPGMVTSLLNVQSTPIVYSSRRSAGSHSSQHMSPSSAALSLLCLACSRSIDADSELSKCVVHSCCSRPVCAQCLSGQPRLATFCVRCEGVQDALRKGPRSDVTRAGQVVFDFDRLNADDVHSEPVRDTGMPAPPAYSERPSSAFIVGGGEDEDVNGTGDCAPIKYTPTLLRPSRSHSKPNVTEAVVDLAQSACSAASGAYLAHDVPNTSAILRETLKRNDGGRAGAGAEHMAKRSTPAPSMRSTVRSSPHESSSGSGLTQQYWLRSSDTLMSLSLRFRINAATLCKLNDLPASTVTSTPHLLHTRSFLLIPDDAIRLALVSSSADAAMLEMALQGPAPMSRKNKVCRAQREAQGRFRALVAQSDSRSRVAGQSAPPSDVTPCDERAASAYVSLMEAELRSVDFGDGVHAKKADGDDKPITDVQQPAVMAEDEALIDAARQRRYDAIVKQALCRWEMDSDWEREQRAMGLEPNLAGGSSKASSSSQTALPPLLRWLKTDQEEKPSISSSSMERSDPFSEKRR